MIKILSKNVADKIAAGEVVDRPISIVKELVENAIDSGADSITIEIKNGGKTYIRVTDNGCGIPEEEIELAFTRHATSKIVSAEDLDSIHTLGFRGEALASISAVSKVVILSKTGDTKAGTSLKIHGGQVFEKTVTGCPEGTTIIVSDLFYNIPARLKFMKTDATESTLVIDFISKIALAYADTKIRLINNGAILFSTNGRGDKYSNIITVYSKGIGEGLLPLYAENENMSIEGYVSRPDQSKTNRKQQIFFVNGRAISNKVMELAVQEGYRERLFEGRFPVAYLFFRIKPHLVDVNIHPNKKEVRFHQDTEVRDFITQTIKQVLISKEAMPQVRTTIKTPRTEVILREHLEDIQKNKEEEQQLDIKNILSTLAREQEEYQYVTETQTKGAEIPQKPLDSTIRKQIYETDLFFHTLQITGSIFNTYITALDDNCFYLIDQHAAHERIFYEELCRQYRNEEKLHQTILIPIILEVPYTIKSAESSWVQILKEMGFDIEPFGAKSYVIKAIPIFMGLSEAQNLLDYFLENIAENVEIENDAKIEKIITRACKAAVKANDSLSEEECLCLIGDLAKCENPYSCPHGRPTFIKMSKYEIEKMFKRV